MPRQAGFTLIEIVFVIGLLGVLAAMGVASGPADQRTLGKLSAAEDAVVAEIRRARSKNTEGLPGNSGTETFNLQEAADDVVDGVEVSPKLIDMVFGEYSFDRVEVSGKTAPYQIEISETGKSGGNTRYLCLHSAIARISQGKCK